MLAISNIDLFAIYNGMLQRWHKDEIPTYHYGLSNYFATATQPEKAIVFDAQAAFLDVHPAPPSAVVNGVIDWDVINTYMALPRKKVPIYVRKRSTLVEDRLAKASADDKHSLSAMLSNFTQSARPVVKARVIAFLLDPKSKKFSLPPELQPKRGRAVGYYEAATQADYQSLKQEIQNRTPTTYNARYWLSVIDKEAKKAGK